MKKTFKTMLALMAGAMTFTGCTSDILENTPEQIPSALKPMTFTAIQEGQGDATRTAISGTAINWTAGDQISIFDGVADEKGNYAHEFTLDGEGGSTSGTFEGTAAEATTYYALYPSVESVYKEEEVERDVTMDDLEKLGIDNYYYCDEIKNHYEEALAEEEEPGEAENVLNSDLNYELYGYSNLDDKDKAIVVAYIKGEKAKIKDTTKSGVQRDGDKFTNVVLPAAQTATAGSADPKAMLMIGTSNDAKNIQFKNVCAYVKVTPQFDCTAIYLRSKGNEPLAGTLTVKYNSGNPTTTVTANGTNEVALTALTGDIKANYPYYIAVRPETLTSGFTIVFMTTDGIYKKSTSKNVGPARSEVLNLRELGISNMTSIVTRGTAEITGGTLVKWVQLWENGPKFAEYNIGASSATDFGGYFVWSSTDIATTQWGSKWRMPTQAELDYGLLVKCTCTWDDTNKGLLCKGEGDYSSNSIFLPAAGNKNTNQGQGFYWSSTPNDSGWASYLNFSSVSQMVRTGLCSTDCSVRAVLAE